MELRHGQVRRCFAAGMALILLIPLLLVLWPVDVLSLRDSDGDTVAASPALLGQSMVTGIIHSLERTPVIDIYRVQEGRLWTWEEQIRSQNAGLPSLPPVRGRFLSEAPWLRIQGDARPVDPLYYRIGTEDLGQNTLRLFGAPQRELWREVPGKRLVVTVGSGRLCL